MKKNILFVLIPILLLMMDNSQAQTVLNSLVELQSHLSDSNGDFVMTPGTYYFDTSNCGDGKLFPNSEILLFTGSNNTFDFSGVKFEFDTDILTVYDDWIVEFWPTGDNNIYLNLTLEDIGNTTPTQGGEAVHLDGADNRIEGFHITVRGSYPYGYGDIFGKGGGSVIGHKKRAGMLVRGDRNHLKDCTVMMRSYGHGIFMQGAEDALIENCYVEGELRTIAEVLEEEGTDSPADNVDFMSVWGYDLRELDQNYRFSLQEDGIRAYTTGLIYETGESRSTTGTQIKNCTVVKMRSGVTIGWDYTAKTVENCTVLACETGYWFGSNTTATGCSGDASVGPLVSEDVGRSNSTLEVTLLDNYVPKIGNTPYLYFCGDSHNLTLNDGTTYFNTDIELQVGGQRVAHRWLEGSGEEPLYRAGTDLTFTNNTQYPIVIGDNVSTSDIFTCSIVTDNGTSNSTTQLTNCDYDRLCNNTADNLQAECYDNMYGIQTEDLGSNNEKNIGYIHANDWISFNDIDLTGMASVQVVAGTNKSGTAIEVRQGSISGTLLATIPLSNTSSFHTYQSFSTDLNQTVNGTIDLYFVFTGGSGYLFNIDAISFIEDPCTVCLYNPVLPISAEGFCDSSGITLEDVTTINQAVGNIHNGDYLRFSNVDFGYDDVYNSVDILASSTTSGGDVEIRSGSVSGTLLATISISNTGSWSQYESFSTFTTNDLTGVHDIFLVFTGPSGYLFNIDNFSFSHDECSGITYDPYSELDALDYCEMFGVVPINDDYLGGIHDGDWIRYGAVDFTSTEPLDVTFNLAGLSTTTGYVNVMLDHPTDGTMIATVTVPQTGGWEVWQEVTTPITQSITGIHEVYIYFGNNSFNLDWFKFTSSIFTPDTSKVYYIDSPYHNQRLGATGEDEDPYTTAITTTGTNVEWKFVAKGNGSWHLQLAAGGSKPRLRSRNNGQADMQATSSSGSWTYFDITHGYTSGTYFLTLPNISNSYQRLQADGTGSLNMVPNTYNGSWESFSITEVSTSSKITDIKENDSTTTEGLAKTAIYPNPVNDILYISNAKETQLEIFNSVGVLIHKKRINTNNYSFNMSNFPSGMYIIKTLISGEISIQKIIKL